MVLTDEQFFATFKDRQARIRTPVKVLMKASDFNRDMHYVAYVDECEQEFRQLGEHKRERRRIILWRVPADNVFYDPQKPLLLKIPFLAFADEEIADNDDTLLPILRTIMAEQLETAGSA